jgi:hypothetical protein
MILSELLNERSKSILRGEVVGDAIENECMGVVLIFVHLSFSTFEFSSFWESVRSRKLLHNNNLNFDTSNEKNLCRE